MRDDTYIQDTTIKTVRVGSKSEEIDTYSVDGIVTIQTHTDVQYLDQSGQILTSCVGWWSTTRV